MITITNCRYFSIKSCNSASKTWPWTTTGKRKARNKMNIITSIHFYTWMVLDQAQAIIAFYLELISTLRCGHAVIRGLGGKEWCIKEWSHNTVWNCIAEKKSFMSIIGIKFLPSLHSGNSRKLYPWHLTQCSSHRIRLSASYRCAFINACVTDRKKNRWFSAGKDNKISFSRVWRCFTANFTIYWYCRV